MECINEMGSFRESAQRNFDNACCAFSEAQKIAPITRLTGIKKLTDKLNPSQPHKLSVMELKLITKASGDYSLVNSLLLSLDMVAVKVDRNGKDETLVKRTLENSINAGELARLTLENSGETRLPRRKRNELLQAAHASVSNLVLLMNDLENKTQGVSPFLSMAVDFVANGTPIPGLS